MKKNQKELILRLQNWYHEHCNGDWEHNTNINIRTIDNPGWRVTIDLEGTNCENKLFKKINKEMSEDNWYHCFTQDNKFEGAGGSNNLIDILFVFEEWVETPEKKSSMYDGPGSDPHYNNFLQQYLRDPHIHDHSPGGIRPALTEEIPK